jgi:hypothetical protein
MVHYPSAENEWPLERKLAAVKAAGFDAIAHPPLPGLREAAARHGLGVVGYISSGNGAEFARLLRANLESGARHINVQLADEDTPADEALTLTCRLMADARAAGVEAAVEAHRDTCTETPEKLYALADAYEKIAGELLPITWDFSHHAVVKHLAPDSFAPRLLVRPDLIRRARQFHFRPFNGHHCQVPVTDGLGRLSPECKDWIPFARSVLRCWLEGNRVEGREIFVCPEMGPLAGGYNLSALPNSWEDAQVLRTEIERLWQSLIAPGGSD